MLVGREDIFPCGETRTLEAATAFCGKSRCLTHMAAVCSTPASFLLIFPTFAPAHHLQPSSLALSPPHFLPAVATIQFTLCVSVLLHACLSLPSPIPCSLPPCLSLFFSPLFPTRFPWLSTSSCIFPPPSIYLHVHQLHSHPAAHSRPALPACLSTGKPCFLSLSPPCQS